MDNDDKNLIKLLKNYLTKNYEVKWLEFFTYNYRNFSSHSLEFISRIHRDEGFKKLLPQALSHYLVKSISENLKNVMSDITSEGSAKSYTENFMTRGLESEIIAILSVDIADLSALTNDRELVLLLTKIFPMSENQSDEKYSQKLQIISDEKLRKLYKSIRLIRPGENGNQSEKTEKVESLLEDCLLEIEDDSEINLESEKFLRYREKLQSFKIPASKLAQHIIHILTKICKSDNQYELTQINRRTSTTLISLNFALDTLTHLQEQNIFSTHDQTTLKSNLMELITICIKNLSGKEIDSQENEMRKVLSVLKLSEDENTTFGFLTMALTVFHNVCMKNTKDKINCMELFSKSMEEIPRKVGTLLSNSKLHTSVQNQVIKIIHILKNRSRMEHKHSKHHHKLEDNLHHRIVDSDACLFEKVLIESISSQQKPNDLKKVLMHFKKFGICCCNATLKTIKIFYTIPVVPNQFLRLVESRIFKMTFQGKFCNECSMHRSSKSDLLQILNKEIDRRNESDIKMFLNHLANIHVNFDEDYLESYLEDLVIPRFQQILELSCPESQENKLIAAKYFSIIVDCTDKISFSTKIFNDSMMKSILVCSLMPLMSSNALHLIVNSLEKIVTTKFANPRDFDRYSNSFNLILFSNGLFLLKELVKVYDQLDLPKNVPLEMPSQSTSRIDNCDFEILDEKYVSLKEALSDIDIIYLNAVHWKVISNLIAQDPSFRREFITNINNNFNGDIIFTIAFNALNTITMKTTESTMISSLTSNKSFVESQELSSSSTLLQYRDENLKTILLTENTLTFDEAVSMFQNFYEITESFYKQLKKKDSNQIYRINNSCATFRTAVHRDIFLGDHILDHVANHQNETERHAENEVNLNFPHEWLTDLTNIWSDIIKPTSWKDRIVQVISKLQIQSEEELKVLHRMNLIREITGCYGLKYLSSIARDCFDICWVLSDSASFNINMTKALGDLKLLLLQDKWNSSSEDLMETLQLLVEIAELKTRSLSRLNLLDSENHLRHSSESIFSEDESLRENLMFEYDDDDGNTDDRDDNTEVTYSVDENYDADEEYFSVNDGETECSHSFRSCVIPVQPINHGASRHICRLVVETLMELSKRCIEKPNQWQPSILITLAQRLKHCMKSFNGGSSFLLRGFSPILKINNLEFRDLQKAILNLIDELPSPDDVTEFMSILTSDSAAVEEMIRRFEFICNKDDSVKPSASLQFPASSSEISFKRQINEHNRIQSIRDIHMSNKLLTPFTESSQMIPLNSMNFDPWSVEGFSISLWMEKEFSADSTLQSHLVSIGSDKLMLAIYLNSDGGFSVNVMKPNQNFSESAKYNKTFNNKENTNKTNMYSVGLASATDGNSSNIRTRGFLRGIVKKSEKENAKRLKTSKICMKSKKLRVPSHEWVHICFSVRSSEHDIALLITLNGVEHELVEFQIDEMREKDVSRTLHLMCIGAHESTETQSLKYSISNVILFRSPLEPPHQTLYLFSLGPDCDNFIDCEAMRAIPLPNFIDYGKAYRNLIENSRYKEGIPSRLRVNALMIYTSGKAISYQNCDHGKTLDIFTVGIPNMHKVSSFAKAITMCGGLSTLLFLLARTIEMTTDKVAQSTALYIFLKMSHSDNNLHAEFELKNLFNLVAHIFKHSNCYRGPGMLKAILDVVYGGTMFERKADGEFTIDLHSKLNIQNPKLLFKLMERFDIFQDEHRRENEVLDMLFKSILVVIREKHPYTLVNRQCLIDNDFCEKLLDFCKTHLTNSATSIPIMASTAHVIVKLLETFIDEPPPQWVLVEFQKLLLLFHNPNESFVTHDRAKFNCFLASCKPHRNTKTNASQAKFFNFSLKIRSSSKSSTTSPTSPKFTNDRMSQSTDSNSSSKNSKTVSRRQKIRKNKCNDEETLERLSKFYVDMKTGKIKMKTPQKTVKATRRLQRRTVGTSTLKAKIIKPRKKRHDSDSELTLTETLEDLLSAEKFSDKGCTRGAVQTERYDIGIAILQESFLLKLRDAVRLLNDYRIEHELPEFLNLDMMIMYANHNDPNVRAAIINLVHIMISRQSPETIAKYEKQNMWIHFGNQLAIHPVNMKMVQAFVDWICCDRISIQEEVARLESVVINYKPAIIVFASMFPAMVHDSHVLAVSGKFMLLLLKNYLDLFSQQDMNYLISSLTKALVKIDKSEEKGRNVLIKLLENISALSFMSPNTMQVLNDLLCGLDFIERNRKIRVVHDLHVSILKQLLSACCTSGNRRKSEIHVNFTNVQNFANLQMSELRTRFNTVLERAVHFTTTWEIEEEFSNIEIDFVLFLIDLIFSGYNQHSSLVLWTLNPRIDVKVKQYTIRKIIKNLISNIPVPENEPKFMKSLLMEFLEHHSAALKKDEIDLISKYCGASSNQQNVSWSKIAIDKIDSMHDTALMNRIQASEKVAFRHEQVVQSLIDNGMKITRNVVDRQNKERRQLMNQLKNTQEIDFYREWCELICRMTHEDAPWYSEQLYPNTWELNETECPDRSRIRLKRSVLKIEERFFSEGFQNKASYQHARPLLEYLLKPKETERYSIKDRVVYTFSGKHLTMEQEVEGEVIVTDFQLIFLANNDAYINSIICDIKSVAEILNRRYQHKKVALEIFTLSRKTFFIIFESNYERDIVKKFIDERITDTKKNETAWQKKWIDGQISNFEYLMELNKRAGRSFNDLMQYPVFPWILTDYESETIDLRNSKIYRRFNKTISTQHEDMEQHYIDNYNYLAQSMQEQQMQIMKPYHYSSHYSNSGTVLHFLVRLPPFTSMFLNYQDQNFDIPDRTFHSISTTFRLTSKESATDVKELIPEFFYLFDFLVNSEGFDFGKRQSGDPVNDVKLPSWCENDPRLFMLVHRQALESEIVRKNLNHWIDLIFGFKQSGNAAIDAINVFHPATYPDFQIAKITDPVERSAYETMIRTYGQMPSQIFTTMHKKAPVSNVDQGIEFRPILKTVKGLRWGNITGSPHLAKPRLMCTVDSKNAKRLVSSNSSNLYYGLSEKMHMMKHQKYFELLIWSENDGIVRVKSLKDLNVTRKLFHISNFDQVTACGTNLNNSNVWFGHESGIISVLTRRCEHLKVPLTKKRNSRSLNETLESIIGLKDAEQPDEEDNTTYIWNYPIHLFKHKSRVINIQICSEFDVVVSIAIDGRAVIWDATKIEYIRTIEAPCNILHSEISLVAISPTLGDILTVFIPKKNDEFSTFSDENLEVTDGDDFINVSMAVREKSQLRLHTINAKYITHSFTHGTATSVCYSSITEGTGVNLIAVGFDEGRIRLFSSWTLDLVRDIATDLSSPISQIVYTTNQHLACMTDREIQVWGSDSLTGEMPKFHRFKLD